MKYLQQQQQQPPPPSQSKSRGLKGRMDMVDPSFILFYSIFAIAAETFYAGRHCHGMVWYAII